MGAKRGIFVAPFEELADPRPLAKLAAMAEERGWEGFFLWDHIRYRPPTRAVGDPWVALSAIACATETLRIGPLVTPLSRRRVQKVARETVTLDHLSGGRLTLGVGLGSVDNGELEPFGEVSDARERAKLLDAGLDRLAGFWGGEFEPVPLQQPRIPVWVAGRWPARAPLRRAARWDGYFPIDFTEASQLGELVDELRELRDPDAGPFDVIAEISAGGDPGPWVDAGATWCLTSFGQQPRADEVAAAIAAGP